MGCYHYEGGGYHHCICHYCFVVIILCGLFHGCFTQTDNDCKSVTTRNDFKLFEDSCFWVSPPTDTRAWNEAQWNCQTFGGGNLATVTRKATVEFLKTNWSIQTNGYWIGLYLNATEANDPGLEGRRQANWKWVDGTTYSYPSEVEWFNEEPQHPEKFVRLQNFKWTGAPTEATRYRFICEIKLPDMPTQSPQQTKTTTPSPPETPDMFEESGTQTPNLENKECAELGWRYNMETDLCYYVQKTQNITWNEAETRCRNINGHLATPSTHEKHQVVTSILNQAGLHDSDVWIGLRHQNGAPPSSDSNQGWEWVDDSPYTFQAWKPGEPGEGEMYARMRRGTWWGIAASGSYNKSICQKASSVGLEPVVPPVKPVNPQSAEDTAKDQAVQTNDPNDVTRAPPASKSILGPALGTVFGALVIIIVVAALLFRTRRRSQFDSLVNRIKGPFSKKQRDNTPAAQNGTDEPKNMYSSIVEIENVRPVPNSSQNTVITSEFSKTLRADNRITPSKPYSENPIHIYATVAKNKSGVKPSNSKLYATVRNIFKPPPKPPLKKASSMDNIDTASTGAYENTFMSTVVRVEELNDWVKEATLSGLIDNQYKSVSTSDPNQSKLFCNQEKFKPKNRYRNIVPYDHNRVELPLLPNDPNSHYINASYIDSFKQKKLFIAAQGPTINTVKDFWRMIWEKSIQTIVMVANQTEPETSKMNFVQYWPQGKEKEAFGDIYAAIKKVENLPDYVVRHISIAKGSDIKIVKHFHFKSWPDHKVPKHTMALINFREKIRNEISKGKKPVLVHCSAGVGRTGTFIAIDYCLQQAARDGVLDFVSCLKKLRQQRTDLIQTLPQYKFLIRAVLEALSLGQTAIPCANYVNTVQTFRDPMTDGETKMQKQFQMLAHYFTEDKPSDESTVAPGKLPENIKKNRDKNILPAPTKRVLLMTPVSGKNDYINAVFVEGHRRKSAYIATHAPLQHTVVDFWRAVFDYNSAVIVRLCPKYYMKTEEVYYPEGLGEKFDVPPFELECLEEDEQQGVKRSQLSLKYCGLERQLLHLSVKEDLSGMRTQDKMATMFCIYENAKKWLQQQTEKKAPVTVHCLEGTEWTGLYCVLSNLFDQINEEQEVDIFHAVGQSRLAKTEFVSTMKQYELVYDIIALYIDQFNLYSNFQ